MKYSSSINGLLNHYVDTTFWQFSQQSNELKNYRQDISGQWDDNAASEVNSRYLHPHEEDNTEMQSKFRQQHQYIQQLTAKLDEVESINNNILALSSEIQKLILDSEDDLRKAVTNFDFASNRKNDADAKIPDITRLLNSANSSEYSVSY